MRLIRKAASTKLSMTHRPSACITRERPGPWLCCKQIDGESLPAARKRPNRAHCEDVALSAGNEAVLLGYSEARDFGTPNTAREGKRPIVEAKILVFEVLP